MASVTFKHENHYFQGRFPNRHVRPLRTGAQNCHAMTSEQAEQKNLLLGIWAQKTEFSWFWGTSSVCSEARTENLKPHLGTNCPSCCTKLFSIFSFAWSFEQFLPRRPENAFLKENYLFPDWIESGLWKFGTVHSLLTNLDIPHNDHYLRYVHALSKVCKSLR